MKTKLENVEFWYVRLGEGQQENRFKPEEPQWSVQLRVRKDTLKEWKKLGLAAHLESDNGGIYTRASLRRRVVAQSGKRMMPPRVVDAKLKPIDPSLIGDGSKGHAVIYSKADGTGVLRAMMEDFQVLLVKEPTEPKSPFEVQEEDTQYEYNEGDESASSEESASTPEFNGDPTNNDATGDY